MTASGCTSWDGTVVFLRQTPRRPADCAPWTSSKSRSPTNTARAGSSTPTAAIAAANTDGCGFMCESSLV